MAKTRKVKKNENKTKKRLAHKLRIVLSKMEQTGICLQCEFYPCIDDPQRADYCPARH